MKKILTSIILVLSLFLLVSCGTKEETKEVVGNQAEVAIILKTLSNPFWVSMKEGIEKEAEKQGIKVDIFAANSEEDVRKLYEQIKFLIKEEKDRL